jgi:hypothetical protein
MEEMQLCPLYSDIKLTGDLDKTLTSFGTTDGSLGMNISIASTEFAALETTL